MACARIQPSTTRGGYLASHSPISDMTVSLTASAWWCQKKQGSHILEKKEAYTFQLRKVDTVYIYNKIKVWLNLCIQYANRDSLHINVFTQVDNQA